MVRDLQTYYDAAGNSTGAPSGISIYMWPMSGDGSSSVPAAVAAAVSSSSGSGSGSAAPPFLLTEEILRDWGTPTARFDAQSTSCNLADYFAEHEIIINLTFCGDWAGAPGVWGTVEGTSKTQSCEDYVRRECTPLLLGI